MGDDMSGADEAEEQEKREAVPTESAVRKTRSWTKVDADALQAAVDAVFNRAGESLLGLTFSLTIADPRLPDCPLIGCSTGFATLCGYSMEESGLFFVSFLETPTYQQPPRTYNSIIAMASKRLAMASNHDLQPKLVVVSL